VFHVLLFWSVKGFLVCVFGVTIVLKRRACGEADDRPNNIKTTMTIF